MGEEKILAEDEALIEQLIEELIEEGLIHEESETKEINTEEIKDLMRLF